MGPKLAYNVYTIFFPPLLGYVPSFRLQHLSMKLDSNAYKDQDKELLYANTAHINIDSLEMLICRRRRPGPTSSQELDDEGDEVEQHKASCQYWGWDGENCVRSDEEVDYAAKDHVVEGVDPWAR